MKRIIIFLLFFFSVTTNLLASFRSDYKVKDDKMRIKFSSNTTTYILDLKYNIDYSCVNMINPPPPTISVTVSPNNAHLNYNQETADKIGKEFLNNLTNTKPLKNDSYRLEKTSIDNFGNNKAFYAEITSSSNVIRAYLVTNEKNRYEIIVNSNKGDNFIYTESYRNFVNSFEISKPEPQIAKKGTSTFDNMMRVPDNRPMMDSRGRVHKKRREQSPLELMVILVVFVLALIGWKIKRNL